MCQRSIEYHWIRHTNTISRHGARSSTHFDGFIQQHSLLLALFCTELKPKRFEPLSSQRLKAIAHPAHRSQEWHPSTVNRCRCSISLTGRRTNCPGVTWNRPAAAAPWKTITVVLQNFQETEVRSISAMLLLEDLTGKVWITLNHMLFMYACYNHVHAIIIISSIWWSCWPKSLQNSFKMLQNISKHQTKCAGYPQCNQVDPAFFAVMKTWEHLQLIWVLQKPRYLPYLPPVCIYIYNIIMGKTWSTNMPGIVKRGMWS